MTKNKVLLKEEDMIKIDKKMQLIPLTFDFMFKSLFINNLELLKEFLLSQLEIEINPKECKIELLNSELPKENKKEYRKTVDIYVRINDYLYVNLEVNREHFKDVKARNMLFADKLYSMMLEQGENAKDLNNRYFIQLNLNAVDKLDDNKNRIEVGEEIVVLYELNSKKIYTNKKWTLIKYLEFYRNLYYNDKKELSIGKMWLVAFTSRNFLELFKILGYIYDDENRDKFIRKVIKMCSDKFILSEWERDKLDELVEITKHENALQEGIEKNKNEVVTNMLNKKLDLELIAEVTNLTKEEIMKIKESL